MIIDTHIHPSFPLFDHMYPYISMKDDEFIIKKDGMRSKMFEEFKDNGICHLIEPAVDLDSNEKLLELGNLYPDYISDAVGNHPTRCPSSKWKDRKKLDVWANEPSVVAIGETGLDYHYARSEQHRLRQLMWFIYQIKIADRKGLPLILHIRMADRDGIRVLRVFKSKIHGGVCHCFGNGPEIAKIYTDELDLCLGIGGTILMKPEISKPLIESVRVSPISSLILETDGPFVKPVHSPDISSKQWRKARNTSLILPAVAKKVAEIKDMYQEEVERVTFDNTVRIFHLENKVSWKEGD